MSEENPPKQRPRIRVRKIDTPAAGRLAESGLHPVLARVLASRQISSTADLSEGLDQLLNPGSMGGLADAARFMADAILQGEAICVVGDYDCDGATATALTVLGLRSLGAIVDYLVPNRFKHGYGLSPMVVDETLTHPRLEQVKWLVTVDNGVASNDGVRHANEHGLRVIVTDHHLPGPELPAAAAIVNPNVGDCQFPSKNLAGVGVAFYLVAATRAVLREADHFDGSPPSLAPLLPLVALGTVADLVKLDQNNRRFVRAGLNRMRSGRAGDGLNALMGIAGCTPGQLTVRDLGFALGPRINAAGRLDDITVGIECLLSRDPDHANQLAASLDQTNRERRRIETDMRETAMNNIAAPASTQMSLVVYQGDWHEGVVGLVAGKLRERYHRPIVAFAPASGEPGRLRGSGRSVPGLHLRDAFALIDARHPGLIDRFGGHAMAAGLSLPEASRESFTEAFELAVHTLAEPGAMNPEIEVDGALTGDDINLVLCRVLDEQIWGQGFAAPVFCNQFDLKNQRIVGERHLKLDLRLDGQRFSAIYFGRSDPLPAKPSLAYRIEANTFRGMTEVQLVIEAEVLI